MWEQQVEENKKLPSLQRAPVPAKSDYLVPKRWEAAALGALQEAGEAYLIGNFFTISVKCRSAAIFPFQLMPVISCFQSIQANSKMQIYVQSIAKGLRFNRKTSNL